MNAQNDLDRALAGWFGAEATITPPPEPLARVLASTRTIRPRPALTARVGSRWVGAGARGDRSGLTTLRPAVVIALVGLIVIALAGSALLVGSRLAAPKSPLRSDVSIFLRRDDGPDPGVSVYAVRPDGNEVFVRKVPDSTLSGPGAIREYGVVSDAGWLALASQAQGWPMILLDLTDERGAPWVVDEASTGGIGPRWGPTGLVAADAGGNGGRVVIADPKTHTTRIIPMRGGLVGGGPSIVWTADGSGIVGSTDTGAYHTVPIDGGDPRPGVDGVFDPNGSYGPGLAELRICQALTDCPGEADGRIERVELDGSLTTIWRQVGSDRVLAARFGSRPGEYWLSVDHDQGRQVALVHLLDGRQDTIATVNRDASWSDVGAPTPASDGSAAVVWISIGDASAAILVPLDGAPPTFHNGQFAGFVDRAAAAAFTTGRSGTPAQAMPTVGEVYALPSLDDLIAAELGLNPGRRVLGKASHDAVAGETDLSTSEVARDRPGADVYLDCLGPSSVTVTSGSDAITSPCLRAGAYALSVGASGPITISSSGDTSWRVVLYSP